MSNPCSAAAGGCWKSPFVFGSILKLNKCFKGHKTTSAQRTASVFLSAAAEPKSEGEQGKSFCGTVKQHHS